jgi:hypothetical protein
MLRMLKGDGYRTIEEKREIEIGFELRIDQCQAGMNQVQQELNSNEGLWNVETSASCMHELYEVLGKKPELKSRSPDSLLTLLPPSDPCLSDQLTPSTRKKSESPPKAQKEVMFHSVCMPSIRFNHQTHPTKLLSTSYLLSPFIPLNGHSCFFPSQAYPSIHCIALKVSLVTKGVLAFFQAPTHGNSECGRTCNLEYHHNQIKCDIPLPRITCFEKSFNPNFLSTMSTVYFSRKWHLYAPCTMHSGCKGPRLLYSLCYGMV